MRERQINLLSNGAITSIEDRKSNDNAHLFYLHKLYFAEKLTIPIREKQALILCMEDK
jgi:hypothetical protein